MSAYAALRSAAEIPSSRRSRLALAACLGVLAVIASMGLLAASGYLIVRASEMPPVLQLTTVIVTVRFFGTSRAVLRYAERLASHDLAFRQLADIRQAFYKRLVPLLPGTLREARSGDLLSRFVADVDQLQELYLRVLLPPLVAGGSVLVAGLVAGVVMPLAAVVLTAALVLAATVVPWVSARVARLSSERQAAARAQLSNELVEALDGSAELALLGQSRNRLRRIGAADAELARYARRDALASGAATALGGVVSGIGIAGVLAVAAPAVGEGGISGPLLGLLALLALAAFEGVSALPAAAKQLAACRVSADRLEEITERAPLVVDPVDALPLAAGSPAVLSVRGVHARAVLRGVDLDLEPGRAVALVGESGSGKTTLAELLVRFADPDAGVIELAGVDIKALAQAELRKHVLLCAQDAHVFSTTIAANLRLAAPGATDDQLADALHAVGLGQFVDSLPDGVDTLTGQDGAQLSGGQRRRLLVARGLLSDAPLVIFDEPAAHLDPAGAEALHRRLCAERDLARGVMVIAHSLTGLEAYDEVLVLHQGQIAERGTHEELVAAGGRYSRMALDQAAALVAGGARR